MPSYWTEKDRNEAKGWRGGGDTRSLLPASHIFHPPFFTPSFASLPLYPTRRLWQGSLRLFRSISPIGAVVHFSLYAISLCRQILSSACFMFENIKKNETDTSLRQNVPPNWRLSTKKIPSKISRSTERKWLQRPHKYVIKIFKKL